MTDGHSVLQKDINTYGKPLFKSNNKGKIALHTDAQTDKILLNSIFATNDETRDRVLTVSASARLQRDDESKPGSNTAS